MADVADDGSAPPVQNRFTDASEDDVNEILNNITSKNTNKGTKFAVKLLKDYCVSKNKDVDFENLAVENLAKLLKEFYINLRQNNKELYSRSSFVVIRQSLNRHFKSPLVGKTFDIIVDKEFNDANAAFRAMCKKMRQEGEGKVQHKPAIQQGDIVKLYTHPFVFNPNVPTGLLNKVFFETILYFCRRGQENLRELKHTDFESKVDDEGKQYIYKKTSELTKNHQGVDAEDFEPEGGRMYATGTPLCPVTSFLKYLNKRHPDCSAFWQRPRDGFSTENEPWYEKKPLGINTLGEMMSKISKSANLSRIYSNYCIRATCITVLNDAGFEGRHIVTISGHRSEESIRNYCSDTSDKQKRDMSRSISSFTTVNENTNTTNASTVQADVHAVNAPVFDDTISEHELILSCSQTEEIMNDIANGDAELQPLKDITNAIPVDQPNEISGNKEIHLKEQSGNTAPYSLMFHNCTVNITMAHQ